ncbi:hypothetical protein DFR86_10050 [Acidianus sulfidivorans JP7]|uniref:CobQ/CobB/MinD/ParA nucleotide binding domain-containing protein n=1 Tax=Acidianus sulfidivorans JP7 TaxID=619593 RepID=A0A2U9IPE3_9CREN|nr:hypothetical protein [Acidianus sulfidivorans]AWR97846.1 hypothetical protein DFR86_10050 [Acidianus sulfidivorans JP7]
MIRVAVFSPKGGVGKSAIIYFLSLILKDHYKILIVDLSSSATLSNLFGITGNIIENDIDYFAEKGNISIVSFSSITAAKNKDMDNKKILHKYNDILRDKDIIFVEYPILLNSNIISLEYSLFKKIMESNKENNKREENKIINYFLPITDPMNYIINVIPNYTIALTRVIDSPYTNLGLVINRYRQEDNQNIISEEIKNIYKDIFIINFYREMLFKGFWNVEIPKEVYPISYKINTLL